MLFLFVFSFAVMISALWESAEFAGKVIGALKAESNKDTMTDLIAGLAGALLIASYAGLGKKSN